MRPIRPIRRFTVVEALLAAVILGLAATAFISLMTFSTEISDLMDRRQTCMQLAVRRTEEIRNRPFSEVDFFVEDTVRINALGVHDANGEYLRTTTLSNRDDVSCHVAVLVASRGGMLRKPTHYELWTVVIDYDLVHGRN